MDTIAVTGGNGMIGRAILADLDDHGYRTVNVARGERREDIASEYRTADLLDAGHVYGSLARADADAVIHMGTIPDPIAHPGYVTYESNVMSSYHVLEAADELGLDAVCLPSSINVLGAAFQTAPTDVRYLPVDEAHPVTPRDPYGLAKHVIEVTADGFGRHPDGPQIATLRYPWVGTDEQLAEKYVEEDRSLSALTDHDRDHLFSYLHLADAASVARRAIEADITGHERFWAVAGDTTADVASTRLVDEYYPDVRRRHSVDGTESLISIEKARSRLGWEPEHTWRG
ncbi:MAG: NAD-dependent epimerase/dehydratase family protein [Halorhabdus sp.]